MMTTAQMPEPPVKNQDDINRQNAEFWNELCGTSLAKYLGATDHSLESLKKFDDGYLDMYPYLLPHVKPHLMRGKKVMEVGLGYGTLGQVIAEHGADYTGLDIAEGPVKMMNHRMAMQNLSGRAIQGSILECPMEDESLDCVISIGCFHHTGDVQQCANETYRVLKPGGRAMIMVYNRFSLRQWIRWPEQTWQAWLRDVGLAKNLLAVSEDQRYAYDSNAEKVAAPETEFFSKRDIRRIFGRFQKISCHLENSDRYTYTPLFQKQKKPRKKVMPRELLLATVGKTMGLDIYIELAK